MKKKLLILSAFLLTLTFLFTGIFAQQKKPVPKVKIHNFASFYLGKFHNRKTASGELYNKNDFTCAHRKYRFGTLLKVTNLRNNKSVIVRVNDRGPYAKERIIDLSKAAAQCVDMMQQGIARVKITKVSMDSLFQPKNMEMFSTDTTYSLYGTFITLSGATIFLWKTKDLSHMLALANSMSNRLPPNEIVIRKRLDGKKTVYELLLNCREVEKDRYLYEVKKLGFFMATL